MRSLAKAISFLPVIVLAITSTKPSQSLLASSVSDGMISGSRDTAIEQCERLHALRVLQPVTQCDVAEHREAKEDEAVRAGPFDDRLEVALVVVNRMAASQSARGHALAPAVVVQHLEVVRLRPRPTVSDRCPGATRIRGG